jgi:acetyl-CoA carboxylase biotin carboxyl carrier protein
VDLKDIRAIIDLMKKNSVAEFELEKPDFKIRLKRGPNGGGNYASADEPATLNYAPPVLPAAPGSSAAPTPIAVPGEPEIKSPMIGTFYRAPSPEAAHYVEVGSEVTPESVVCIIEAMKVMNEIKAEAKGIITQVLIENGKPVEFGQPRFKIRAT